MNIDIMRFVENPYDQISESYLVNFKDEVLQKPFDQQYLDLFAQSLPASGNFLDLGCGASCQQSRYLQENYNLQALATDISRRSVELIRKNFPHIKTEQLDMRNLDANPKTRQLFNGVLAFYSLIHIPKTDLPGVFKAIAKTLKPGGMLLIAGHTGDHDGLNEDKNSGQTFYYRSLPKAEISALLLENQFETKKIEIRNPIYPGEFPSDRIYVLAQHNPEPNLHEAK